MKVLDCTLRDGGYYNAWDFDQTLVAKYLDALAEARVEMVELGLRNFDAAGFKGPYFFTTETYLADLNLPAGPEYGVMVDAKTILNSGRSISEAVQSLFVSASESRLTFVRLACHFKEVAQSVEIVRLLKDLGYQVYVNLMQISLRSDEEIANLSALVASWGNVDGLYFADSLGNMKSEDVQRVVRCLRSSWRADIGIHTHNNMGQALSNALEALELGVTHIDATATGMGRGAGNAEIELLLAELQAREAGDYKVSPLADVIIQDFQPMKEKMGWGPSLHYYMAARHNVHPTYIQKILTDNHFGLAEKVGAIDYIPKLSGKVSYDEKLLSDLVSPPVVDQDMKSASFRDILSVDLPESATAVLIGAGDEVNRHLSGIGQFIRGSQSKVFAINTGVEGLESLVDTYVISHNAKRIDQSSYQSIVDRDVIAPVARFSEEELSSMDPERLVNFPMNVKEGTFESSANGCLVPLDLTAAYALAALGLLGFKKVYLAGFDGYGLGDPRQKEMSEMFYLVRKEFPTMDLVALTPTTYPVTQESVYAPIL